jgi:hypothetical protein
MQKKGRSEKHTLKSWVNRLSGSRPCSLSVHRDATLSRLKICSDNPDHLRIALSVDIRDRQSNVRPKGLFKTVGGMRYNMPAFCNTHSLFSSFTDISAKS